MSIEMPPRTIVTKAPVSPSVTSRHAAWQDFVAFCEQMRFGEIEKLKIQDGLPVMAEIAVRKVRFGG